MIFQRAGEWIANIAGALVEGLFRSLHLSVPMLANRRRGHMTCGNASTTARDTSPAVAIARAGEPGPRYSLPLGPGPHLFMPSRRLY